MPQTPIKSTHAQAILDCVVDGVFTVDAEMRITYFNCAAERITGIPRDQAIGQYCFEVLRANICERACALQCSITSGQQTVGMKVDILRPDGRQIPISISTAALRSETGEIIGGVESFRDLSQLEILRREVTRNYRFEDIVSKNHAMEKLFDILPYVADSISSVLIEGPSGSGKELLARAIHHLSGRSEGPFIAVNCGALPDTLLESELFGYVRGAFTDARRDKPGRFALADGGSLLLDEVDSLPKPVQVKLLRAIQEREYTPLGGTTAVKSNVRIIAASKTPLRELVDSGHFRDDLYFRLNVVRLQLPPLADRRDDIPLLVERFVEKFNTMLDRSIRGVTDEVMLMLMMHEYPGNVRQLENIIEHAFVMCRDDVIDVHHLPAEMFVTQKQPHPHPGQPIDRGERQILIDALARYEGNRILAAQALGMHRTSLWRKLKKHNLV